jgi:hypothetical protein
MQEIWVQLFFSRDLEYFDFDFAEEDELGG